VVVLAQAATLGVTWSLWQAREEPALLPMVAMPSWLPASFGVPLLASLLVALRWPRLGASLHALLLALAMVADQTRLQPQLLSMALLVWATSSSRSARVVGALHLIALWFWSGLGKLTSVYFLTEGGAWLLGCAPDDAGATGVLLAALLGSAEVMLAVAALVPRWRGGAAIAAVSLHVGIAVFLSPLGRDANPAVLPWNVALAAAAPSLLAALPAATAWPWALPGHIAPRVAALLCLVLPVGFHLGWVDAPVALQVYTLNASRAVLLRADGRVERLAELPRLRVQLPPVARVQRAWFEHEAQPGDQLVLRDVRPLALLWGGHDELVRR
jgi:hypothetical protein